MPNQSGQNKPSGNRRSVNYTQTSGRVVRGVYTPGSRSRVTAPPEPEPRKLTGEQRLDILGGVLIVLGIFSGLSLFSNGSQLAIWWAGLLKWIVGWGVFALPIGLIISGLYLLLRRIERIPRPPLEKVTGYILMYITLLGLMHFFGGGMQNPYLLAERHGGGGYIGASILNLLLEALGGFGAFLILLALLLLSLVLSFDVSLSRAVSLARERLRGGDSAQAEADVETYTYEPVRPVRARPAVQQPEDIESADTEPEDFIPIPQVAANPPPAKAADSPRVTTRRVEPEKHWDLPKLDGILEYGIPREENEKQNAEKARIIEETLRHFGAPGRVVEILSGPAVTMFGVEPDYTETRSGSLRVRVAKIVSLRDDLALALAATHLRIQAPVPGQSYVGIEVPNDTTSIVRLRDVMESTVYKRKRSLLKVPLGKDVAGTPTAADLATMPHLLIAGATGSGKSVCVNALLTSLLLVNTPNDLRLVLVDPKRVELIGYNGIPHLLTPVIVQLDKVVGVLQWMIREMQSRYQRFASVGTRNLEEFNNQAQQNGVKKLPILLIVIDEMADLMMQSQGEPEVAIARLAQMSRATGIHLILATQRPSTDIITGNIKANFPARIAFAVASNLDSRVILDSPGAEQLLGRGDMLYQSPDAPAPVRMQGVYVSDEEIQKVVDYWIEADRLNGGAEQADINLPADLVTPAGGEIRQLDPSVVQEETNKPDPMTDEVIALVRKEGRASISMLQTRLRMGYTRAARMIAYLEEKKIIGPQVQGAPSREVLDYGPVGPPRDDGQ
jgi:S-DNA-T family DNA segregation ATPase FtsK/SpoIIIE